MVGARISKKVLKIRYKSSLVYLGIGGAAVGIIAIEKSVIRSPMDWLNNLSSYSGDGKESKRAIEGCFLWGWPQLQAKIILELISLKNTLI